jgi:hypothetical protein
MSVGELELLRRVRRAITDARLDWVSVVDAAQRGECQFLQVDGAVAITALVSSGPFKTCQIMAVAGDLSTMAALDAKVEEWARENGCQAIETVGRKGWSRIPPPAPGFEVVGVKYRKTLEE